MLSFAAFFWVLVTCICCLFGSIITYLLRFRADEKSKKFDLRESQIDSNCLEILGADKLNGEREDSVIKETSSTAGASKYQFTCVKDFSGFIEEPQTLSFTIQEWYVGLNDGSISNDRVLNTDKGFQDVYHVKVDDSVERFGNKLNLEVEDVDQTKEIAESFGVELNLEAGDVDQAKTEESAQCFGGGINTEPEDADPPKAEHSAGSFSDTEALEKQQEVVFAEDVLPEEEGTSGSNNNFLGVCHSSNEVSENYLFPLCLNQDLARLEGGSSISNYVFDSNDDESLGVGDVGEGLEQETLLPIVGEKVEDAEENPSDDTSFLDQEADVKVIHDDLELESHLQSSSLMNAEVFSEKDNSSKVEDICAQDGDLRGTDTGNVLEKPVEPYLQKSPSSSDSDDDTEWENLWEHGTLLEQLKMELRNVRTRGLPTILEESESPKMVGDLKPLKIEEKLEHKDVVGEIQKFYKRYADKMRKLDILNYQTVHAISFLQLKDSVQSNSNKKPSVPTIKSLLLQKASKLRRLKDNPTLNLIRELHKDLEMVYVGQVCLSWEILHWQYGKAQELQEYDPNSFHQYCQATSEFQQFQVLVQRFIENEPFQGPRVQYYVKNRLVVHKLLQVPVIKDDCFKDKKEMSDQGQDAISGATLTETIEKSIRVFWDFLRADKDGANPILKGLKTNQLHLQNPAEVQLLMDIQTDFQKKEKKLKDLLRSKNCIVKRIQKHQEDRLDRSLLFAQVELRLVSRVLNMSRLTTDQLAWCHIKLSQINIVNRRIFIEPSFVLFP